ncbi:alpha-ketoacid dehydrogenase subunit beta [Halobacteriales archaeon SW_8_65_20]|nr:MAG: alpha-ketoacid dehydrogenase subunit beta [Halobacteriales archaeon SW_8_65_20]
MSDTQNLTLVQAVRDGLKGELERDDDVVVFGEDVGKNGGVFRATQGLYEEFGEERVFDTPLAESGIVGTAVGMAAYGMKPVPEMQFSGFAYPGFDQIVSHAARLRTRSRSRFSVPMTLRMPYGGGIRAPEHHSESKEAFYAHEAGLKVVVPSYRAFREEVPDETYTVELGEATTRREGDDVSLFTWGAMTRPSMAAAENLAGEIDVEVVDLRTLSPMDWDSIVESFKKTGRAVVVHEAPKSGGLGAEIATTIQEEALGYQRAPVQRVTGFDTPFPLYALEDYYMPEAARIEDGIREAVEF